MKTWYLWGFIGLLLVLLIGAALTRVSRAKTEYVSYARGILRDRSQADEKDVLGVVRRDVHMWGPRDLVPELVHVDVERADMLASQVIKSAVR